MDQSRKLPNRAYPIDHDDLFERARRALFVYSAD